VRRGGFASLAVLAFVVFLVVYFFEFIVQVAVVLLAAAVVLAVVFYLRIRLAMRRFRAQLQEVERRRRTAAPPEDVVEAEFKVKDD
jgi:hypothetical protein